MPTVRYDARSFFLDDRRVWLTSGAIHYFRVPSGLWADRLLKAKRAGLNCIETYVAWNVHEPLEGQWDFTGDHDVRRFVQLAKEVGLYVILRPGPYICAEWDFGGLPAWLVNKSGIAFRTANAAYMHYFDKYFAQVLPRLADLQVTRGGNIILIQNENEYFYTTMPDRLAYCQFINQLFRRAGFDIPFITCNDLSEPRIPDAIECYNGWGDAVEKLKRLRRMQPNAPLLTTEFWAGWFDCWGGEHQVKPPAETARRALEILGCGSQINYYMWHGGTNFGFSGSRLAAHDSAFQTTSYDYDAPLAEGGGLTPKYYLTKLVNMFSTHMGHVLAEARAEGPGVTVHSGTQVLNLTGPAGGLAVVTRGDQEQIKTARISTPDGVCLDVSLEPLGATVIPIELRLPGNRQLDYANLMPLGVFGENILALHGPAGFEGRLSIDGKEIRQEIPAGEEPILVELLGQKLLLMNTDLAMRSWPMDEGLVVGPNFVGAGVDDVTAPARAKGYVIVTAKGEFVRKKFKPAPAVHAPPKLETFARVCICDEPVNDELAWQKIDRPRDPAAWSAGQGYSWYRLQINSDKAGKRPLFLPDCEDRAAITVNGNYVGVWGRGPAATREPINVALRKGANTLVFLVDNLGRFNYGPNLGQPKGIFGPVWCAEPIKLRKFKVTPGGDFSKRMLPRMLTYLAGSLEQRPLHTAQVQFSLPRLGPVHLSFTKLPYMLAVNCNGRQAAFFPNSGGFGDVVLSGELTRGTNTLSLLIWGDVQPAELDSVRLHALTEQLSSGGQWSFRKWEAQPREGKIVGKDLPAWYRSHFGPADANVPLFVKIAGAHKGQIVLNGHNVGRFWSIGPQEHYYLPAAWLREQNELSIFEEHGHNPTGSSLAYRSGGPFQPSP